MNPRMLQLPMAASRRRAVAAHIASSADEQALESRLYLAPINYILGLKSAFAYLSCSDRLCWAFTNFRCTEFGACRDAVPTDFIHRDQ